MLVTRTLMQAIDRQSLEAAGAIFIEENGEGPGAVRRDRRSLC